MPYGYNGKILRVNLSKKEIWVDEKDEYFYRRYMGGGAIGSYYILQNVQPGTDAYDPNNFIVFSGSIVSGAPLLGFTRHSVTSISPLTGGIFDSEAGGYWIRELKKAGFDAVVVQGCSSTPVYLLINDGKVEIKDASHLWGQTTGDAQEILRKENDDEHIRVLGIGPAGENKVRFANIVNELTHFNGRGGLGAVMGSKNLKAIAVKGSKFPELKDKEKVKEIAKIFIERIKENPNVIALTVLGTGKTVGAFNKSSQLPTRNFSTGYFENAENICGTTMAKKMVVKKVACFGCPIACKREVQLEKPYHIDPKYGGPEYESLAALGAYTGISDLFTVAKANELCSKYTLDTISTGAVIAFAMDCYEKGLINNKDTDGLELNFGNSEILLPLIKKIAFREGIGNIFAEGVKRMAERLKPEAKELAVHCKGLEFAAHEPRVKSSLGLAYGLSPLGGDHMVAEMDTVNSPATADFIVDRLKPLGINERLDLQDLGSKKVRFFYITHIMKSALDCLDICMLTMAPSMVIDYKDLIESINSITGWETSLWEVAQVGERRIQMMRAFNMAAGMTKKDDLLPPRMYEPLTTGITKGQFIDKNQYKKAIQLFYKLIGWDSEGIPKNEKFIQLDLEWVINKLSFLNKRKRKIVKRGNNTVQ